MQPQQQLSTLVTSQNSTNVPQMVTSPPATALAAAAMSSAVAASGCPIGGSVPEDDKCSVIPASAVPANTPYSNEPATAATVGQYNEGVLLIDLFCCSSCVQ